MGLVAGVTSQKPTVDGVGCSGGSRQHAAAHGTLSVMTAGSDLLGPSPPASAGVTSLTSSLCLHLPSRIGIWERKVKDQKIYAFV